LRDCDAFEELLRVAHWPTPAAAMHIRSGDVLSL
jgi:hypothetical protein